MLVIRDLGLKLGKTFRIHDISFQVDRGERVVILGPNGSGKTTLLRLIAGLETPGNGTISWNDKVLSRAGHICVPPHARGIGILFQEGALFPHLSVYGNIALALPQGMSKPKGRQLIERALKLARIHHLQHRAVDGLSGGEQQRTALSRSLVHYPQVLLLDEPFHSLDGPAKGEILTELRTIAQREEIAVLLVTHEIQEASLFSDRIVLLQEGRKVQEGTFAHLYQEPADAFVAQFMGPVQSLTVEKARQQGIGMPDACVGSTVSFRAEHLVLSQVSDGMNECPVIVEVRCLGATHEITIELADGCTLISKALASCTFRPGQRVCARLVHVFDHHVSSELRS